MTRAWLCTALVWTACTAARPAAVFAPAPPSRGDLGDHALCAPPGCKIAADENGARRAGAADAAVGVDFQEHVLLVFGDGGGARIEGSLTDIDDAVIVHVPADAGCEGTDRGFVVRVARTQKPLLIQRYQSCVPGL